MRSAKAECAARMIFFGRSSLEHALTHYVVHYHEERHHQGLKNHLLRCSDSPHQSRWSSTVARGLALARHS
jgi:putative transposase